MHSQSIRDANLFIVDVFVCIHKIKAYTATFKDGHHLQGDSLHWDASMRAFQIIGESLNYLLEDEGFKSLAPSYFRKIVNFRNVIVHGYFGIDPDEVWDIVTHKLDGLNKDLLYVATNQFNIREALILTIKEYSEYGDEKIVQYLNKLSSKI